MWKPYTEVFGKIVAAKRLNNSVNGNPRYEISFENSEGYVRYLTTSSDSACSYEVENVMAGWNRDAQTVTLGLTRAGRVATITREQ